MPTKSELIAYVRAAYGLKAERVEQIEGREHAESTAYRIVAGDAVYFLKLGREQPSPLARHLVDSGIRQVLAPLRPNDPISTGIGDAQATLYPYIKGEDGFRRRLNEDQWTALGAAIRAVHDVALPEPVSQVMRREAYTDVWRRKVRGYLDPTPAQYARDDVSRELLSLLWSKRTEIEALVGHAEQLASSVSRRALPVVPCHGDLHAGNVLIDQAGTLTIVDWDDPVLAPRERDLMFIGAGIGGVWNRPEECDAFYRGYGAVRVDAEALAYYRCERIVEDIAVFCDRLLLRADEDAVDRKKVFRKLAEAFGPNDVVEIAERTFAAL
jgi:spectinomycin phosphotransferase